MTAIVVTLPLRIVSVANLREHWATKARRARAHRAAVVLTLPLRAVVWAHLCVTFTRIAPRALDDDNLRSALKAVRDGVADALGCADNDPRVTWAYAQERGAPKTYAVRITIESREGTAT